MQEWQVKKIFSLVLGVFQVNWINAAGVKLVCNTHNNKLDNRFFQSQNKVKQNYPGSTLMYVKVL